MNSAEPQIYRNSHNLRRKLSANSFTGKRVTPNWSKKLQNLNSIQKSVLICLEKEQFASSLSIKLPKSDSKETKPIPGFLFFSTLEISNDKYKLSSKISQLVGLILLQCCWRHVKIKLIYVDNYKEWQRECTDKTKIYWAQCNISNLVGSHNCVPYSQNVTKWLCP